MYRLVAAGLLVCAATTAAACDAIPPAPLDGSRTMARSGDLTGAWYAGPVTHYDHAVLGDGVEASYLVVQAGPDCLLAIAAGDGHVFEDVVPHLADLDADGTTEVLTVRSSLTHGAQLAVYDRRGDALALIATTPPIGQPYRWMAPIGAGDVDGDGRVEVAAIDRPHLDRMLRVWRLTDGALVEVYRIAGLTNHRIGDRRILGGMRTCYGVTTMITADAGWTRVIATRIDRGRAVQRDLGPIDEAGAVPC